MARPKGKEAGGQSKRGATKVSSPVKNKKKNKQKSSPSSSSASRGQSQSCHQCRQSIHSNKGVSEVKSGKERLKCSQCTRFWCEQCLHNRYGVIKAEMDPSSWSCPVCSKKCNCSLCRRKEGKLATGILTPLVKNAGFDCVSEFLDKGTDDIAKVLQWKSPESAGVDSSTSKSCAAAKEGGKTKPRKRRRGTSDHENSKSLANGTKSKSSTPPTEPDTSGRPSNSTGSHSDSSSCHSNGKPKRRKLTHSTYSITIEEDSIESSDSIKVSSQCPSTNPHPNDEHTPSSPSSPVAAVAVEDKKDTQLTPCEPDTHRRRSARLNKRQSTVVCSDSPRFVSHSDDCGSVRRSPRKRKRISRYLANDFRPVDQDSSDGSPNDQDSPHSNDNDPHSQSPSDKNTTHDSKPEEDTYREDLKEELKKLRASKMKLMRSTKMNEKQKVLEARASTRAELRRHKREERARLVEEKRRANEEKKLSRIAAQEKLKLARNLLKDAQKDVKRRQKERDKLKKQEELRKLKEHKQNERKRMQELVSVSLTNPNNESTVSLVDDSPASCQETGVPPLPDLPQLELSIHHHLLPQLIFVSEFLFIFADAFHLRRRLEVNQLCQLLAGGRGLGEVYLQLLKVILEEEEINDYGELKPSKSQRDLEQVARRYLHDNGRNGFIDGEFDEQSLELSLVVLHHLCEEALDTMAVCDHMTVMCEQASVLRKEQRAREKEMSKQISGELKQLCEGQACSLDQVEAKRREFTSELWELRKKAEWEQYKCGLVLRNNCIGRDRHDRVFWKLQSVPGVLVEEESNEGASCKWLVIDSMQLLEEFIECLHPTGRREKLLIDALNFHKSSFEAGLLLNSHGGAAKKFYGK